MKGFLIVIIFKLWLLYCHIGRNNIVIYYIQCIMLSNITRNVSFSFVTDCFILLAYKNVKMIFHLLAMPRIIISM